jgi:hypothetical protein
MDTKKSSRQQFVSPSSFLLLLDPGWKKISIRDNHPGSAILVPIKEKYYQDSKRLASLVLCPMAGRWMERVSDPADDFLPPSESRNAQSKGF